MSLVRVWKKLVWSTAGTHKHSGFLDFTDPGTPCLVGTLFFGLWESFGDCSRLNEERVSFCEMGLLHPPESNGLNSGRHTDHELYRLGRFGLRIFGPEIRSCAVASCWRVEKKRGSGAM